MLCDADQTLFQAVWEAEKLKLSSLEMQFGLFFLFFFFFSAFTDQWEWAIRQIKSVIKTSELMDDIRTSALQLPAYFFLILIYLVIFLNAFSF